MKEPIRLLFVDDEENILNSIQRMFLDEEYDILTASSCKKAFSLLEAGPPVQVVVSDYRMPEMNGVEFLHIVSRRWPDTVRMVLSGYSDTGAVIGAINEGGIFKFIPKPWNETELKVAIANAATLYFLQKKVADLAREGARKDDEISRLKSELKAAAAREGAAS